jgi:thiol-disulfide isomerase/thioredoxin
MWFKEILQNKSTVIFIIIIILLLILYYLNNNNNNKDSIFTTSTQRMEEKFQVENPILTDSDKMPPVQQAVSVNDKVHFKVFYTNWCGWSKRALATLNSDEFKNKFNEVKDKADVVLVDCEGSGKEECAARKINGYPTMQLMKGEKVIDFNGDRTPDGIVTFIKQNC